MSRARPLWRHEGLGTRGRTRPCRLEQFRLELARICLRGVVNFVRTQILFTPRALNDLPIAVLDFVNSFGPVRDLCAAGGDATYRARRFVDTP